METLNGHERLMRALQFSEDDLAANRAGHLSAVQHGRLRARRRRIALTGAVVLVVLVLAATTALYFGQVNRTQILTIAGIVLTVIGAVVSGVTVRNWYRLTNDIDRNAVAALAGTVQHTVRVTGRSAAYFFRIDETEMIVPKVVFLAVRNGGQYRFYRTPHARILLSAEPL